MTVTLDSGLPLEHLRRNLVDAPDSLCLERARLVTEAFQAHPDQPVAMKRALALQHVLEGMCLDLDSNPVFAGNTSSRPHAWMLIPEHGFGGDPQVVLEHPQLRSFPDREALPADLTAFWQDRTLVGSVRAADPGHFAIDQEAVVHRGLRALAADVRSAGQQEDTDPVYRRAMLVCLEAVMAWGLRYAEAAEHRARTAADQEEAALHRRVACACRRVPALPARNLFEALQAMALVHLALALEGNGMSVSVGLPDRALAPFAEEYSRHPGADRLLAAFLLKLGANSILGRGSKTQAITVGGCDAQGRDCSNAVTDGFLRAADLARVGDPHVFLRCHPGLAPGTQSLAASLLSRGLSMPLLVNDTPTIQGFMAAGVPAEHATRYCVIGCNELGIPGLCCGTAMPRAGTIEYVQLLNDTLYALPDPDGIASLDEVLRVMGERMEERLEAARRQYVHLAPWWSARAPVPLASALMTGPRTRGLDLGLAMTYEFPGLYERGLANAVNALAALHQVVFRDKRAPLSEVIRGLQSNHGDTTLRRALQDSPKWGNDDPEADRWAQRLLELRERVLERVDQSFGHSTHFVCHVIRSLHHLDGGKLAASADGRRAGEPLGDSIGAVTGTARSGATAVLNSVAKIETTRFYRGGCNLNLTLVAGTPEPTVEALITAFFAAGGQELQINCLNPGTLRDAQHCPEHHGDLVVRVAGLSARFVDLGRREQDELIARAEAAAR